jgi:hypothetical protein
MCKNGWSPGTEWGFGRQCSMRKEREGLYRISFEQVVATAKEVTLRDGGHVPLVVLEGSRKLVVSQIQDMPESHGERMELMRLIGREVANSGQLGPLLQAFMVSEGWMSSGSKDDESWLRPSQDPDRKEVLIVSGLQIKEMTRQLRLFEMVRDATDHVVELPEMFAPEGRAGDVEIPLLQAVANGFRAAGLARAN